MGISRFFHRSGGPSTSPQLEPKPKPIADLQLPQHPLTPREIEELHAKLHPEKHGPPSSIQLSKSSSSPIKKYDPGASPTHPQTQSPLFGKLPPELRERIWCFASGGQDIYWTVSHGHLRQAQKLDEYMWWPKRGLLDIPLVCRAVYDETISLLYSANTFHVGFGWQGTKEPITQLPLLLSPSHVAAIRHLKLGWHLTLGPTAYNDSHPQAWDISLTICPPDDEAVWLETFGRVATLPNLEFLEVLVWISGSEIGQMIRREQNLLEPLVKIKGLKQFRLCLPWASDVNDSEWKDAPFNISRDYESREWCGVRIPRSQ